jgi:hypothetical protein
LRIVAVQTPTVHGPSRDLGREARRLLETCGGLFLCPRTAIEALRLLDGRDELDRAVVLQAEAAALQSEIGCRRTN